MSLLFEVQVCQKAVQDLVIELTLVLWHVFMVCHACDLDKNTTVKTSICHTYALQYKTGLMYEFTVPWGDLVM